jgi:multidrug efflux pump
MTLPELSLKRPVLVLVLNLFLVLFGILGFRLLGVREFPSVDPPVITVTTSYAGANPDIVESQITEPLEKTINGIAGVRSISSSSNQGKSLIRVEFELSANLDDAANDVRDKVGQALNALPTDIDAPPVVTKADANSDAILSLLVQSNTRTHLEVNDFATRVILERIQTIPGVSTVQIWGEKRYAMRLWLDPLKMKALGVDPAQVAQSLQQEHVELPSGKITGIQTELTLKTMGQFKTAAEFENLIVVQNQFKTVRLGDIGRAELGAEKEETVLKESGIPMVALALVPQPGANYLDIAAEFYRRYDLIKKEVPSDIRLDIALDSTIFIKKSIGEVAETLIIAVLLVILIVFLFFRNLNVAFRPLIDIPVSLISTFFVMFLLGYSINVLTLLAIVLATGLVVDDGIVVTENIFKKLEQGKSRLAAVQEGAAEINFAVISTSIALAVVFLPIVFLPGFVGRLFREFGIVMATAILVSAFVSLTLTVVLNLWLAPKSGHKTSAFYEKTEPFFQRLNALYQNSLAPFFSYKYLTWGIFGCALLGIFFLYRSIPKELAPLEDRSSLRAIVTAPEGVSYEYMFHYMDNLVQMSMDSVPEKTIVLSVTSPGFFGSGAPNTGFLRVRLCEAEHRNRSQADIAAKLSRDLNSFGLGRVFIAQEQTISTGNRLGRQLQLVIQHAQFDSIKAWLPAILDSIRTSPKLSGVDVDLKFNKPENQIVVSRGNASALGLSILDINNTLQLAYTGKRLGYFTKDGRQYPILVQMERIHRNEPSDILSLNVVNSKGIAVPLENAVEILEVSAAPQIYHYNRYQSATLQADPAEGIALGDAIQEMNEIADAILPSDFSKEWTGPSRDFLESSGNTTWAFLFALLLVYLILAIQFESFIDPFIVMLTVPLALFGALYALWAFGFTLNIFSEIGIIMLIGLVTKNGILIVEFANQLQKQGNSKAEAAQKAAAERFRPILMTSMATALGALPIALSLGAGSESRQPLGVVIVAGILFSLILTLYLLPVFYATLSQTKLKQPVP